MENKEHLPIKKKRDVRRPSTSRSLCLQQMSGDCPKRDRLALKEIDSIHASRQRLFIKVTIIFHLLLREIFGYQIPVGLESKKTTIMLFGDHENISIE